MIKWHVQPVFILRLENHNVFSSFMFQTSFFGSFRWNSFLFVSVRLDHCTHPLQPRMIKTQVRARFINDWMDSSISNPSFNIHPFLSVLCFGPVDSNPPFVYNQKHGSPLFFKQHHPWSSPNQLSFTSVIWMGVVYCHLSIITHCFHFSSSLQIRIDFLWSCFIQINTHLHTSSSHLCPPPFPFKGQHEPWRMIPLFMIEINFHLYALSPSSLLTCFKVFDWLLEKLPFWYACVILLVHFVGLVFKLNTPFDLCVSLGSTVKTNQSLSSLIELFFFSFSFAKPGCVCVCVTKVLYWLMNALCLEAENLLHDPSTYVGWSFAC